MSVSFYFLKTTVNLSDGRLFCCPLDSGSAGIDWNSNFFHGGVHMLRRVGECILFAASMAVFMVVFYLWAA